MKLFSRSEAQASSKQTEQEKIGDIALLEKTLFTLQQRINTENDLFNRRMSEQRTLYSEEKARLQEEIRQLERKVAELHEQRSKVIVPSMELIEKCKATYKKVLDKLQEITQKEELLDEQLETVHVKLDDISTRECILKESEQKFSIRKQSIEAEAKAVSDGHIRLNGMLADFNTKIARETKILTEKENALSLREKMLQDTLKEHTKQIQQDKLIIKDQRETLEKGFAELRKKQNETSN